MASVPSGERQAAAEALRVHEGGVIGRMVLPGLGLCLAGFTSGLGYDSLSSVVAFLLPFALLIATYLMAVSAWKYGALPAAGAARASVGALAAAVVAELVLVSHRVFEWGDYTSSRHRELTEIVFPIELALGVAGLCAMLFALAAVGESLAVYQAKKRATACAVVNGLATLALALAVLDKERRTTLWTLVGLVIGMVGLMLYVRLLRLVRERLTEAPEQFERVSMPF